MITKTKTMMITTMMMSMLVVAAADGDDYDDGDDDGKIVGLVKVQIRMIDGNGNREVKMMVMTW